MFYAILKSISQNNSKVIVELKNDMELKGNLVSVDTNLNLVLSKPNLGNDFIFLMQKLNGEGVVFLEIDGSSLEFDLKENEQMVLSTGYLVSMSETCSIDIQVVKGIKNILIGGEGIFNTVITGPGKVVTQTMPLARLANSMIPFLPIPTDNNSAMSTNTNVASSVINMLTKK